MTLPKFKFLDHPADIKLQVFGADLSELFVNAALGMMSFLYGEQQVARPMAINCNEKLIVNGDSLEMLLVNWLGEILFLSDVRKCIYTKYQINIFSEQQIIAVISGSQAVACDDIKAVTYHELVVSQTQQGWQAIVVFDI